MMNKPYLQALNNEHIEKVPFWFMRQAGRYLPEYRELRAEKGGFLDMVYDPKAACEITMQPIRRFEMDAAILFSDILVIPQALGQKLEFVVGEGPKLEPIQSLEDFDKLNYENFDEILSPIYQTVSNVRASLKAENYENTALIGFAGSPWTVACYMIEGQGSKDFMKPKVMAYKNPELFQNLTDLLVEATASYLIKQIEAGAEAVQLFESWAGVLDANQFKKWVVKPTQQIVQIIRRSYPDIPIIGFPKGAGYNALLYAQDTGISALGLDSSISTSYAKRALQPLMPVQGNLDPFCLYAGGDNLTLAVEQILIDLGSNPFIFNLGHGIHKDTPINHVEHVVRMIKDYKK